MIIFVHNYISIYTAITSDKNLDKINKFKKLLEDEISVLKDSIQNINYAELDIDCYLNPKCIQGYRYAFGKIHSLVFVDSYEFPFQMIKDELEKIASELFICEYSSYQELYILILIVLNYKSNPKFADLLDF